MSLEIPSPDTVDDFVEYWLHLGGKHHRLTRSTAAMQAQAAYMCHQATCWTQGHIWHRDSFMLVPCTTTGHEGTVLYGRVYWGENIDDEWLVVWVLLQLTRLYPDLVVSVMDNDGQFLLIEAALAIPRWIKPANAAHRVYLYQSKLHIIPLVGANGQDLSTLTAQTGPTLVRSEQLSTSAPVSAQTAILERLRVAGLDPCPPTLSLRTRTPSVILPQQHRARVWLPVAALQILSCSPGLVASAVEAYCSRDPIDMRMCKTMEAFPPSTREFGIVRFSRCLYAQLQAAQCCAPPRPFGPLPARGHPDFKAIELGVKLSCGFEIAFQTGLRNLRRLESSPKSQPPSSMELNCEDSKFKEFLAAFEDQVMCNGNHSTGSPAKMEDSKVEVRLAMHGRREQLKEKETINTAALAYYTRMLEEGPLLQSCGSRMETDIAGEENVCHGFNNRDHSPQTSSANSLSVRTARAMQQALASMGKAELHRRCKTRDAEQQDLVEDSEDWLQLSEAEVASMLHSYGTSNATKDTMAHTQADSDRPTANQVEEMQSLSARMQSFLANVSGLDGVESDKNDCTEQKCPGEAHSKKDGKNSDKSTSVSVQQEVLSRHQATLEHNACLQAQKEAETKHAQLIAGPVAEEGLLGHEPIQWPSKIRAEAKRSVAAQEHDAQKGGSTSSRIDCQSNLEPSIPDPKDSSCNVAKDSINVDGPDNARAAFSKAWLEASPEEQAAHLAAIKNSGSAINLEEEILNAQNAIVKEEEEASIAEEQRQREDSLRRNPTSYSEALRAHEKSIGRSMNAEEERAFREALLEDGAFDIHAIDAADFEVSQSSQPQENGGGLFGGKSPSCEVPQQRHTTNDDSKATAEAEFAELLEGGGVTPEMQNVIKMLQRLAAGEDIDDNGLSDSSSEPDDDFYGFEPTTTMSEHDSEEQRAMIKQMREVMGAMDAQLMQDNSHEVGDVEDGSDDGVSLGSRLGESFVRHTKTSPIPADGPRARAATTSDINTNTEVDIAANLAHNLAESVRSQEGRAGPTSTLLGAIDEQLPRVTTSSSDGERTGCFDQLD